MPLVLTWERITRSLILVTAAFAIYGYFTLVKHPYIDLGNTLLVLGLLAILYLVSGRYSVAYPASRPITFVIYVFVAVRMVTLIYYPYWLFISSKATYETIRTTMVYFNLGTILTYAGMTFGSQLAGKTPKKAPPQTSLASFRILAAITGFACLAQIFNHYLFGFAGSSGSGAHLNFFSRYVTRLFEPTALLIVTLVHYALLGKQTGVAKKMAQGTVFLFLFFLTITGSRAALYEVFILFLCLAPVFSKQLKFGVNGPRVIITALLIIIIPFWFNFSTELRRSRYSYNFTYALEQGGILQAVSRRLSLVEALMFPLCRQEMRLNNVDTLVNIDTTMKSTLNRLIPGKPFGQVLFSEFGWCYMIRPGGCLAYSDSERTDYVGYEWGSWGISYQLFGYLGGLAFLFAFAAVWTFVLQTFRRFNNPAGLSAFVLAVYALQFWIKNLGLDNWVDRFAHTYVLLFLYLFILGSNNSQRLSQQFEHGAAAPGYG